MPRGSNQCPDSYTVFKEASRVEALRAVSEALHKAYGDVSSVPKPFEMLCTSVNFVTTISLVFGNGGKRYVHSSRPAGRVGIPSLSDLYNVPTGREWGFHHCQNYTTYQQGGSGDSFTVRIIQRAYDDHHQPGKNVAIHCGSPNIQNTVTTTLIVIQMMTKTTKTTNRGPTPTQNHSQMLDDKV